MGNETIGVEGIVSASISSSNCSDEAAEGISSSDSLGITYSSSKGTRSFDGMDETGIASIGFAKELVNGFIFFEAEESDEVDAFLFFTTARSAALVFFTSDADGRIGVGVGAGGAEDFGSVSSGAADAVALTSSFSSGAPLLDALTISSAAGMQSSALVLSFSSAA